MSIRTILSIDGGGIRGIIPAKILAEIERRTGTPCYRLFDYIAGTSTGGILAVGLACPSFPPHCYPQQYTAHDLVELYQTRGKDIFHRSFWHEAAALVNLAGPKYNGKGAQEVFEEYFGSYTLGQSLSPLLVTSYDIVERSPHFFKSWQVAVGQISDFRLSEICRATSAAPTYFPPAQLSSPDDPPDSRKPYTLIDGGVFANNPTMCILAEVTKLHPGDDVFIVSLGTGDGDRPIPFQRARRWGLAGWARPLVDILIDGVSEAVDYQVREMMKPGNYYRFQCKLPKSLQEMDDVRVFHLNLLETLAEKMIKDRSSDIDKICSVLATE